MSDEDRTPDTDIPTPDLDEPIDVEFREAEPEPSKARGPGWSGSLLLACLAALGGGVLGYVGAEIAPGYLGGPVAVEAPDLPEDIADKTDIGRETEARLELEDRLTREVTRLEERIGRAEERLSAPPIQTREGTGEDFSDAMSALEARLDAIEVIEPGGGGVTDAELARSLAGATSRIETLEARLDNEIGRHDSELHNLDGEIENVRERFDELRSDVAAARTDSEARITAAAEAALALSTIDAAARRGQPFGPALEALERVRPDLTGLDALQPIAGTGAPTMEDLIRQFPAAADAARNALQPDIGANDAMGVMGRLFGDAVQVRRDGDGPVFEALEEAETALEDGDLGRTIASLERVDGAPGEALADWLDGARGRRTLERTLDRLRLDLMAEDR